MQATLGHLVFSIDPANRGFYRDLFNFLGWQTLYDVAGMLGIADANGISAWFADRLKDVSNDYDGPGLNHFAINLPSVADVDTAAVWLYERGIPHLFETPRHRPEFAGDDVNTYYQVMFETPDRILVEIVYIGPK